MYSHVVGGFAGPLAILLSGQLTGISPWLCPPSSLFSVWLSLPSLILPCYRPNRLYYQPMRVIHIHSILKDYPTACLTIPRALSLTLSLLPWIPVPCFPTAPVLSSPCLGLWMVDKNHSNAIDFRLDWL